MGVTPGLLFLTPPAKKFLFPMDQERNKDVWIYLHPLDIFQPAKFDGQVSIHLSNNLIGKKNLYRMLLYLSVSNILLGLILSLYYFQDYI